jgi:dTDP-4-dehydrorhamnose reductase
MRVLITGSNGQLGSEIKELAANYKKIDFFCKDLPDLDICNFNLLQSFITENNMQLLIVLLTLQLIKQKRMPKLQKE